MHATSGREPEDAPEHRLAVVRTNAYRQLVGGWQGRAILACSGGVDSTALVILAAEALRSGRVGPFVVCHVDHRSRPDSAAERNVVERLCDRLNIPFAGMQTASSGPEPGRSMEDVWRERRYRALFDAGRTFGARAVVTAHNQDDQLETVLMRMLAGSTRWLIPRESTWTDQGEMFTVVRPLLNVKRIELQQIVDRAGVQPLVDPGNVDVQFRRSAVRTRIIPQIESAFGEFSSALVRAAVLREQDGDFCDDVARTLFVEHAVVQSDSTIVAKAPVLESHVSISTRLLRLAALSRIDDTEFRELTYERVEAILRAAGGQSGTVVQLPYGIHVTIEREHIAFR